MILTFVQLEIYTEQHGIVFSWKSCLQYFLSSLCLKGLMRYFTKSGILPMHNYKFQNWTVVNRLTTSAYDTTYLLLTAIGLSPGDSSTVHIYTQTIHRTTQNKQYIEQQNNLGECVPCPVLASYTLAFALQLRKKHGKTSVRVAASKNT